ncbi:MAG: hypothetical protein ABII23_03450 [bacterium]
MKIIVNNLKKVILISICCCLVFAGMTADASEESFLAPPGVEGVFVETDFPGRAAEGNIKEINIEFVSGLHIMLHIPAADWDELTAAGWKKAEIQMLIKAGLKNRLAGIKNRGKRNSFFEEIAGKTILLSIVDTFPALWSARPAEHTICMKRSLLTLKKNAQKQTDRLASLAADAHFAAGFTNKLVYMGVVVDAGIEHELARQDSMFIADYLLTSNGEVGLKEYEKIAAGIVDNEYIVLVKISIALLEKNGEYLMHEFLHMPTSRAALEKLLEAFSGNVDQKILEGLIKVLRSEACTSQEVQLLHDMLKAYLEDSDADFIREARTVYSNLKNRGCFAGEKDKKLVVKASGNKLCDKAH